ncbi:MAG: hypothetical protein K6E50_05110 [Lachnospiraceae bacterium]|nr:hypothetical protein [Lachnospiraceae bacterium]
MKENSEGKKKLLRLAPYPAVFCAYVVFCLTEKLYLDIDNYNLAIICNGMLGNNNFCQYVHPLLCLALRLPKCIFPSTDVFTALAHLLLIVSLGWMLCLLFERFASWPGRLAVLAAAVYLCFGVVLWNVNYTVWAAFFSFVGCLGIFSAKEGKEGRIRRIAGAALYGFGLMFRWEAAFILLPYIALTILAKPSEEHFTKGSIRRELMRFLPWLVVFAGLGLGRNLFYSAEPWKSGLAYDNARRILEDFPVLQWDEMPLLPEGVDEYTYRGVTGWTNADTDDVDVQKLCLLAEYGKKQRYQTSAEGFVSALLKLGNVLLLMHPGELLIPLCVLLLMAFAPSEKKLHHAGKALALFGSFIILLYFEMRGRNVMRLGQSVLLAAFLPAVFMTGNAKSRESGKAAGFCLAIALLFLTGCFLTPKEPASGTTVLSAADGTVEERFASVCKEDQIFLVGGWLDIGAIFDRKGNRVYFGGGVTYGWSSLLSELMDGGKLPSPYFLKHFIPAGWYWYGQEYYRSFLEELGVENPVKALVEQDRMRLWDRSEDSVFREYFFVYLYRLYGDMDVIRERTADGYPLYRFEKK